MPELPEVESVRLGLQQKIVGQRVLKVKVLLPKIVSGHGTKRKSDLAKKQEFIKSLQNQQILNITRRAKNLIMEFSSGAVVLIHLKMTGQLIYRATDSLETVGGGHPIELSELELPNKHTYIIFELEEGVLYYNDVRQFGYVLYYPKLDSVVENLHFRGLGVEPLSMDFQYEPFYQSLKQTQKSIKQVFLEQKVVVGLGNIYADEVAFAAGVRPTRRAGRLTKAEILKIYQAIKEILPLAVRMGGSSVANYKLSDGTDGNYAKLHMVYGRGGKECKICGNCLKKIEHAGRGTVYCPNCQK